jgi:L-glutamine-phosphate cytidylyltransferase
MEINGLILAAGRGRRMGNLTDNSPKGFLLINKKRLIDWQLNALKNSGIRNNAIVIGYKRELFDFNTKYFINASWDKTNSVSSLLSAEEWFKDKTVIVSYSDIIFDERIIKLLIKTDGNIVIPYLSNWIDIWSKRFANPLEDAETFNLNDKGEIIEIGQTPRSISQVEGQYLGILKIEPKGWSDIKYFIKKLEPNLVRNLDLTALLNLLIKNNYVINSLKSDYPWYEFDSQEDINSFKKYDLINNFIE